MDWAQAKAFGWDSLPYFGLFTAGLVLGALAWALLFGGSGGKAHRCGDVPGTSFIACRTSDTPKDWKERNCMPEQTLRWITFWHCRS
jgi:hypothetical protein